MQDLQLQLHTLMSDRASRCGSEFSHSGRRKERDSLRDSLRYSRTARRIPNLMNRQDEAVFPPASGDQNCKCLGRQENQKEDR
ncbi:MAG: hypothetical protein DSM106950_24125 [Stigonema ocellatum SAG 48.90 = DSM 106950]|nr:hypothetical protein [Stigonema ocellatum SAG 48.90 = DSM 106950]